MKRTILLAILAVSTQAHALIIPIDIGFHPLGILGEKDFSFSNPLIGTELVGQHLTLDFVLAHKQFARITSKTDPNFFIVVRMPTSGTDFVPWGPITTSLLDSNLNPLQVPQAALAAGSSNPFDLIALIQPHPAPGITRFSGIRFDLTLPNDPGVEIIEGGFFRVSALASVPDSGATLPLFAMALIGLAFAIPATRDIKRGLFGGRGVQISL